MSVLTPYICYSRLTLRPSGNLLASASDIVKPLSTEPFKTGGGRTEWSAASPAAGVDHKFSAEGVCVAITVRYGELWKKCSAAALEDRRRAVYVPEGPPVGFATLISAYFKHISIFYLILAGEWVRPTFIGFVN